MNIFSLKCCILYFGKIGYMLFLRVDTTKKKASPDEFFKTGTLHTKK